MALKSKIVTDNRDVEVGDFIWIGDVSEARSEWGYVEDIQNAEARHPHFGVVLSNGDVVLVYATHQNQLVANGIPEEFEAQRLTMALMVLDSHIRSAELRRDRLIAIKNLHDPEGE